LALCKVSRSAREPPKARVRVLPAGFCAVARPRRKTTLATTSVFPTDGLRLTRFASSLQSPAQIRADRGRVQDQPAPVGEMHVVVAGRRDRYRGVLDLEVLGSRVDRRPAR